MPKSLVPLAATLAALSVASFLAGAVMLGIGISMPSRNGGGGKIGGSILSGGGEPDAHGWEDGHPVGLYLMTRFWIATGSLEKAVYYFTGDGRVYVDLEDGFSDDILAKHKGRHGTVRTEGDEMIITWEDGKESRSDLEKADGGFNWDAGIFGRVEPFENDDALVGRWEGGSSVSFSGGSSTTSQTLELKEDGTFTGSSAASIGSDSRESSVRAGSSGAHDGKWELDGYSLILQYSDGRTARGVTFPFDDEKTPINPDRFYFSGTMYRNLAARE